MRVDRLASVVVWVVTLALAGCAMPPPLLSRGHLAEDASAKAALTPGHGAANIPELSAGAPRLPAPRVDKTQETYSVVVNNVSAQTLLFALARDAKLNLDVHPGLVGNVTLNALDQTIHELLERISRQIDMRYELDGKTLFVLPDTPFLRLYKVDYPNISRDSLSSTGSESQVATTGQGASSGGGSGSSSAGGGGGNSSLSSIRNISNNRFWATLIENIRDLLRETNKVLLPPALMASQQAALAPQAVAPAASAGAALVNALLPGASVPQAVALGTAPPVYREAASVIANPETGVISVRATSKQHARVREFLDQIVGSARRQVLIEATIVEVALTNDYQQGVNWSAIRNALNPRNTALSFIQSPAALSGQPFIGSFTATRQSASGQSAPGRSDLSATVRLLESFGKTRVLSSPKVSVMNNQTALLKVVDNKVYFTMSVTPGTPTSPAGVPGVAAVYTTVVNTVPVGFLMNVTAQIGDDDEITLNLRPTVSRITGYAIDPNPALALAGVANRIPEIQTREFESLMKVRDGETAVLGGLMQDDQSNGTEQIPGVGNVPLFGELFKYRSNQSTKSELVIFLRPTILRDASIDGDASFIRSQLSVDTPVPVGRRP